MYSGKKSIKNPTNLPMSILYALDSSLFVHLFFLTFPPETYSMNMKVFLSLLVVSMRHYPSILQVKDEDIPVLN
jgi:hypothetical protein